MEAEASRTRDGYHRLADLMTRRPEFALIRRFKRLHVYDLLSQMAELTYLEYDLERIVSQDRRSEDPDKKFFDFCIESLRGPHEDDAKDLQWKAVLDMRQRLRQYGL